MSDVQQYLLAAGPDKTKASIIASETVESMEYISHVHPEWKANQLVELESKKTTLIEVVQSLGEYINDEDATIRARTIAYLSEIIGQLSPTFLSRQQIQILCQFLCARIEDGGAVGGLRKLQGLGRFNTEMAVTTFRA